MGGSVFTRIIKGEIPCYKVAEDDKHFAFLDIYPLQRGHVLVIPKKETDYIFDLTDEEFVSLQLFSKKVAIAVKKAIPCERIAVAVMGLEVPHVHIHLIPINQMSDCNFANPKLRIEKTEFEEIAQHITENFSK